MDQNHPETNQSVPEQEQPETQALQEQVEPEQVLNEPSPSLMSMLLGVFMNPAETAAGIKKKASWLIPLLIVIALMIAGNMMMFDAQQAMQKQAGADRIMKMQDKGQLSAEQAQEAIEGMNKMPASLQRVFSIVGILIFAPIIFLVTSALLLLIGNVFMGGSASFKQYWTWAIYSSLITTLGSLIKGAMIMMKDDIFGAQFGLGLFLEPSMKSIPFMISQQVDLFAIWAAIVVGIGLAVLTNSTRGKGITWSLILYVGSGIVFGALSALPAIIF